MAGIRQVYQLLEKEKVGSRTHTDKFHLLRKTKLVSTGGSMGSCKSFQTTLIFLVPPYALQHVVLIPDLWVLLLFLYTEAELRPEM